MKSSKPIKVAFLANDVAAGGAAKSLLLLFESLQKYNIEIYLYVTKCSNEEMKNDFLDFCMDFKIVNIVEIHAFEYKLKKLSLLKYTYYSFRAKHNIIEFAKDLNSKQIDILHINSTVFSLVQKIVKSKSNVKIITHLREVIQLNSGLRETIRLNRKINKINKIPISIGYDFVQRKVIENINNYSDYIISISNNELVPFISHNKQCILPNPYDFNEEQFKSLQMNKINNKNKIDICMISSFQLLKNHMLFLKAVNILKIQNRLKESYRFYIFGSQIHSPYAMKKWKRVLKKIRNYIQRRIDYNKMIYDYVVEHGLYDIVKFVPRTYHIKEYIADMDIVIRPDGFPWGRDIIESMAIRKAIIACGYSDFYIEDEKTGILIPPASPKILANMIVDLADDPEKRKLLGDHAYKRVKTMCDLSNYGEKVFEIYNSLLCGTD